MRFGERRLAATASAIATTSLMKESISSSTPKKSSMRSVGVGEVGVERDHVDMIEGVLQHLVFPGAVGRHVPVR